MKKQVKKFMSALLACVMVAVSVIVFDMNPVHAASGAITEASGWLETAYVKWTPVTGATGYNVYVKSASASDSAYVQLDDELIRKYPSYMRADAVGLKAGDYVMKIVPLNNGKENTAVAIVSDKLTVKAHDRSGFTFSSNSPVKNGVGAYNNDGTLKSNASVLYVTEANKNTVKMKIGNTEYTGVAAITQAIKAKNNCQPVAIRIIGQVTLSGLACKDVSSAYAIGVKGASNVTFEGIGDDATLYEAGVVAFQSTGIEVRNLGLMNWGGGGDGDGISLKQSVGVWVHNNDVFYGNAGSDGDQAKGDGSMDLKDNSQYVTVSYNHFWDSGKMSLCGMKSESGENWITYHHNWFDHSDSRHPRIRTMSVHVYNNYYDGNSKYGVGAAKDSEAFVEANYFRHCNYPMLSSMQGSDVLAGGIFSGENGGIIKAFNNYIEDATSVIYANSDSGTSKASTTDFDAYLASSRSETVPSTYKAKQGGKTYSNFDTKVDLGVDTANIDAPADVPSIVTKYAGRIMGGDFKWTFDNSVDDTSHSLNRPLKDKLNAYKTSLVSVGGGSVSTGEKHVHNYVSTVTKKATCAEEGEITYTCTATNGTCDKKTYTEVVPKTAHTYGEWKVVKEATETEEGLKSHSCTVCGAEETASIPKKGSTGGTETPEVPTGDSKVHNFTTSDANSSFFVISGNLASNKGTVTYNGLTLTQCLKMESSTSIKFTAPSAGKLTLVFGESGKNVKINGKKNASDSNCIVTVDVAAGSVEITKGDTMSLYYMIYTPSGTSETTHTHKYESKITKQATCTEAGVLTYTCTSTTGTCDKKTYTETIPAKGHSFSTEWTVDVEATETTPGSKSHHCTVCDAKTDVTEIPATGIVEKPLTITASKTEADKTVTFTAEAAGGKEGYTYKFIVYNKTTGTWGVVQNYSSKNTCTWTKGSAGDRYFYVDVKDAAGNVARSEALNVKIEATAPKVTLIGSSETVNAGAKLTLTAQTTLGSGCTYKFIIFNPATNQWFKLQDFSSSNTFTWTAGSDGTRLFYVDVKDADGNVTRSKALNVTIGNGSANWLSVKATVSSNTSKTGDKITFTAEGVGGKAGYTYKMVVYNKTTKIWGLVQNFSSNNTITWTAGTAGDREFYIDVKDADGNVARSAVMNVITK
uniref:pectate lyase family protein n=1 Tax=Lachnospira eligens TaxID=39485 RepID=UPI004027847B